MKMISGFCFVLFFEKAIQLNASSLKLLFSCTPMFSCNIVSCTPELQNQKGPNSCAGVAVGVPREQQGGLLLSTLAELLIRWKGSWGGRVRGWAGAPAASLMGWL